MFKNSKNLKEKHVVESALCIQAKLKRLFVQNPLKKTRNTITYMQNKTKLKLEEKVLLLSELKLRKSLNEYINGNIL